MSVLHDVALRQLGSACIQPFDPDRVRPSSVDLRLHDEFRVFNNDEHLAVYLNGRRPPEDLTTLVRKSEFIVHPGEFILGATLEEITVPDDLVVRIEGKSSVGRLGLIVHATAGFVDPGFHGRLTLEMTNLLRVPIVLSAGVDICQVSFQQMVGAAERPYGHPDLGSRYQGDTTVAPSRYGSPGGIASGRVRYTMEMARNEPRHRSAGV